MYDHLKIGIIGYGRIGKIHYQNVKSLTGSASISICSPRIKEGSHDASYYTDFKQLLHEESPDAIIICSPTPSHYEIIEACSHKGIQVFCEKPIDLDIEKVEALKKLVDESGIICQVGFNRRYDPEFSLLKSRIENGEIGDTHQITLFSRDPGLPPMDYIASSGGMLMDMTIHDFDMCRYLTGSEVTETYCKGQIRIDPNIEQYDDIDTATSVLTFKNGAVCTIHNSREAIYGYDQRIEVFGSKGMIAVDNLYNNRHTLWSQKGRSEAPTLNFFLERYAKSYKHEMAEFLENVIHHRAPQVGIKDAFEATKIAVMAKESMKSCQVVYS